jgi:ribosomal-protein-alanine N-acetyltransferase
LTEPAILETQRLLLREFTLDDAPAFLRMCTDPEITRYTGDPGTMTTLDDARAGLLARPIADYARHGFGRLACVLKASNEVIGFAGLEYLDDLGEVDIGYRFFPEYWGQGLATEAAFPLLDDGFTRLKLPRILGLVHPENAASVRILQKLGMAYVETFEYFGCRTAKYVIDRTQGD